MTYDLKKLQVASLDFDDIVTSLSRFLKEQPELKDINFDDKGTAANMLINILATATAYSGVYAQFGYVNSWPVTSNLVEGILSSASLSSILIPKSQSASCNVTLTPTSVISRYTTFYGNASNGTALFFFNVDELPANTSTYTTLYSGTSIVSFSNYDYVSQSCTIPATIDPRTITLYTEDISTSVKTYWTKVEKGNETSTGNQNIFTVLHGPGGAYIVTTNLPNAQTINTDKRVFVQGVVSNGSVGNGANVTIPSTIITTYSNTPFGGYDSLSLPVAKAKFNFNASGYKRCVTLNDFKNAIVASGISGTEDSTLVTVANDATPSTVNVYVQNLSEVNKNLLLVYLSNMTIAGITVQWKQ
jgi:hypothetical protein